MKPINTLPEMIITIILAAAILFALCITYALDVGAGKLDRMVRG
jgi:hypothetical protein